ncbi:hypothetical protein DTO166G4_2382 [Paecilomyces variotii]|nr:hypothetical protein DTO166G4_2382 [Paecilomyces variotii]KAJ9240665.1 hypothetical protein DTO166G5_1474 [Paecilomyces variotii]KAJ9291675.1 hypothetical protein DTO021C3_576 [Paecilomyces variotii]KAJ9328560.1 hypothetical protein DTO027B3_826 [Paecilomyces variotii]KAJ9330971.1 hypothetical protein DTO027B5_7284 [Paecilomyces variotii]
MENKEEQAGASVLPIRSAPQVENDQDQASHTAQNETLEASNVQKLQEQDDDRGEEEDMMAEIDLTLPEKKKKKKRSKKPKSKRGLNKPTGFEEFYVDPPITVEEYNENKKRYDVSLPILIRLEEAILRFQAKRRIENDRSHMFSKYLAYGGVDVGQKMFAGVDQRELEDMDTEQILAARAQAWINSDRSKMLIDFDAVVRGYLTAFYPRYFYPDTEEMAKMGPITIRNFLTYLLHHDVCPEYKDNIDAARVSCDIAIKELWKNQRFIVQGPGNFNEACSTLFGGSFYDDYVEENQWAPTAEETRRMTPDIARKVVKFALAGAGSNEQATRFRDLAHENALCAVRVDDIDGFEITAVESVQDDLREFYHQYAPDLNPVGKLHGKAFRDPARPLPDLTPEERLQWEKGNLTTDEFEFIIEESLLDLCYPGMKVITSVWKLNCGICFFDEVMSAYCSIYTVLPNDLMLGWKKPSSYSNGDADGSDGEDGKEHNLQDYL